MHLHTNVLENRRLQEMAAAKLLPPPPELVTLLHGSGGGVWVPWIQARQSTRRLCFHPRWSTARQDGGSYIFALSE